MKKPLFVLSLITLSFLAFAQNSDTTFDSSQMDNIINTEDSLSSNEIIIDTDIIMVNEDELNNFEFIGQTSDIEKISSYLNNGTNVNTNLYNGNTILLLSISQKNQEKYKLAISKKANVKLSNNNKNNILHILFSSYSNIMFDLINNTVSDVDLKTLLNSKNKYGETPLHIYMHNKTIDDNMLTWFRQKGADFNSQNNNGQTILHYSVSLSNCKYSSLLNIYTKSNIKDNEGNTAIDIAEKNCSQFDMATID